MQRKQSVIRRSGFGIRAGGLSCAVGWACGVGGATARADVDPLSGIDFVTIGSVGNPAYSTLPGSRVDGRGRVDYQYNIGKFEITTAQWVEFANAAYDRAPGDFIPWLPLPPSVWGAGGGTGGNRWGVPAGNEMRGVGNLSWRAAAIYANWLHNGKGTDRAAFLSGAYDVSTFGYTTLPNGIQVFTDQAAHSPAARYWIPTWDEWLKAAHYDPSKVNSDGTLGGYWQYANMRDTPLIYGPPGVGMANAGGNDFASATRVLLGSYPDQRSPWGLFDTAGMTGEWTEEIHTLDITGERYRNWEGSYWVTNGGNALDRISITASDYPDFDSLRVGFRIASSVPTPGACALGIAALLVQGRRRVRKRNGGPSCERKFGVPSH